MTGGFEMGRTTKGLLFSAVMILAAMPVMADREGWADGPGNRRGPRCERGGPDGGCFEADARREWREEHREAREAYRAQVRENLRDLGRAGTPREERLILRQMRRDRIDFLRDRREAWGLRKARREDCRNVLRACFPSSDEEAPPAPPMSL